MFLNDSTTRVYISVISMRSHLAIFSERSIKQILDGKKTIETRFSQKRIAPFGQIGIGDLVYIKPPGKEIVGQFKVKKVISIEGLDNTDLEGIKSKYGSLVSIGEQTLDKKFFESHKNARYGSIIFIGSVEEFIVAPIKISKSDLRGWMVLD